MWITDGNAETDDSETIYNMDKIGRIEAVADDKTLDIFFYEKAYTLDDFQNDKPKTIFFFRADKKFGFEVLRNLKKVLGVVDVSS
jgi:hypothetical protein